MASIRTRATLSHEERPDVLNGLLVSANHFEVLGLQPAIGRFFRAEESESIGTSATTSPVSSSTSSACLPMFGIVRSANRLPLRCAASNEPGDKGKLGQRWLLQSEDGWCRACPSSEPGQ